MKNRFRKSVFYVVIAVFGLAFVFAGYVYYRVRTGFQAAVIESQEIVLAEDLAVMRKGIKQYTHDKGSPPQSLKDLVGAGYIPFIPPDPFTNAQDWQLIFGEYVSSDKKVLKGIVDVRSSSPLKPSKGKPYNQW